MVYDAEIPPVRIFHRWVFTVGFAASTHGAVDGRCLAFTVGVARSWCRKEAYEIRLRSRRGVAIGSHHATNSIC
jgi:hypothetical protein